MSRIEIRDAAPADASGVARVQIETWHSAYKGIVPDAHLAEMDVEKRAERWRDRLLGGETCLAAVSSASEIVGWATYGPEASGDRIYTGELFGLYVHPSAQRQGIGRRLTQTVARRLSLDGHTALLLWTLSANVPACRFYEALDGLRLADRHKQEDIGGLVLDEVAYGWPDIRILESDPK